MHHASGQQALRDPDVSPTNGILVRALGEVFDTFVQFTEALPLQSVDLSWRYYSDGKAWLGKGQFRSRGKRGAQKEKTLFWLSVWEGFFKVTIYITQKQLEGLLNLSLSEESKKMIQECELMGKIKFFPLVFAPNSQEELKDLFLLIDYKKSIS